MEHVKMFFEKLGFDRGLAMVYAFWGDGVGHDVKRIWDIAFHAHNSDVIGHESKNSSKSEVSVELFLSTFALIPLMPKISIKSMLKGDKNPKFKTLAIPGNYYATVSCPGSKLKKSIPTQP